MVKRLAGFLVLFLFCAPAFAAKEETKPAPAKASSLWGIRRGPKAPKNSKIQTPVPSAAPLVNENAEKAKELNRYYEEKVKGMYGGPQPGSPRQEISMTTGSEQCAASDSKK